MMMDDWGWGFGLLGTFLGTLFYILVMVVIVIIIVKLIRSSPGGMIGRESAGLRVLDELYARGEITRDEYLERKSVLKQ